MDENTEGLTVETLSYPVENGMTQCLYWGGRAEDRLSVFCRRSLSVSPERLDGKVYRFGDAEIQEKIQEIKGIIHGQGGKMPMDLFYLDPDGNAHTYEIKAGGNLDTKNKVENRNEVMRLEKIFPCLGTMLQSSRPAITTGVRAAILTALSSACWMRRTRWSAAISGRRFYLWTRFPMMILLSCMPTHL